MKPPRSYLFVPATRPERIAKALASGADAVIVDLEDAVAPADKEPARRALSGWLDTHATPVYVRINAADSPWFAGDLALCGRAGIAGIAGIVLPKAQWPEDVATVAAVAPVLPLIESARGIDNVRALAAAPRVQRLLFGAIDFALDLGIADEREALLPYRAQLVLASKLAGLPAPVDGVTTATDDDALVAADTHYARRLGFGARLCIHPRQVAPVHEAFAATPAEVAWARRVLAAASASGGGAVQLDGRMIDRPVIAAAEKNSCFAIVTGRWVRPGGALQGFQGAPLLACKAVPAYKPALPDPRTWVLGCSLNEPKNQKLGSERSSALQGRTVRPARSEASRNPCLTPAGLTRTDKTRRQP